MMRCSDVKQNRVILLMSSIFSKIVVGAVPCYKIAEDDRFLAFLDAFPLKEGHTLVIPKQEIDNFFDLPKALLRDIMLFAQPVAKAIEKAFPQCLKCGMSVVGLEVPHAHIHLMPLSQIGDMSFHHPKLQLSPSHFEQIRHKIIKALNK